jgi:hypothetical protein
MMGPNKKKIRTPKTKIGRGLYEAIFTVFIRANWAEFLRACFGSERMDSEVDLDKRIQERTGVFSVSDVAVNDAPIAPYQAPGGIGDYGVFCGQ